MGRALVTYFSQGGTTARIGAQIAQVIKEENYDVDLYDIRDRRPPDSNHYDLLGVDFPVYIFRPPFNVLDYVNSLPNLNGKSFFVFLLYGGAYPGTSGNVGGGFAC